MTTTPTPPSAQAERVSEERVSLRNLVDDVWQAATDSKEVPSISWADELIDKWQASLRHAPQTSGVQRYGHLKFSDGHECSSLFGRRDDGEFVEYADYATLAARVEELNHEVAAHCFVKNERDRLLVEVEALRAAAAKEQSPVLPGMRLSDDEREVVCDSCGGTTGFMNNRGTLDVCDDPFHEDPAAPPPMTEDEKLEALRFYAFLRKPEEPTLADCIAFLKLVIAACPGEYRYQVILRHLSARLSPSPAAPEVPR